jgi:6-pyruvoyltetrahydropterin/6-carboxytetrahydropterin synthase
VDPVTGIGVDLAELKRLAADSVVRRFDHAFLNDDPAFVSGVVPTTENLVRVIWDLLRDKLGADRLARIRLWEDPTLHVEYAGEA